MDPTLTAKEAVQFGFANEIVDGFDKTKDFFDPSLIPAIPKLLSTDLFTITNAMHLLNSAKDNKKIEQITRKEAETSFKKWHNPESLTIMRNYMASLRKQAKEKKTRVAKM